MNILLKCIVLVVATNTATAAVYNCNGTFTDTPCNTPALNIKPANGGAYVAPKPVSFAASAPVEAPKVAAVAAPQDDDCTIWRRELRDARWRKANFVSQRNVSIAEQDEKELVHRIWSKCSKRFE